MKKLFESWRKHINESIGEDTLNELVVVLSTAYAEGLRSYSPSQTDRMGNPVNPDAHTEVVNQLMELVRGELENMKDGGMPQ